MVFHNGNAYPAKDAMVWVDLHTIQRQPNLFPSPDEFIPERFLPAPHNWQEVLKKNKGFLKGLDSSSYARVSQLNR